MFTEALKARIVAFCKSLPKDVNERGAISRFAESDNEFRNAFRACYQQAKKDLADEAQAAAAAESRDVPSDATTQSAALPAAAPNTQIKK